jgi:uncharacterized protein with FMN-binding domain
MRREVVIVMSGVSVVVVGLSLQASQRGPGALTSAQPATVLTTPSTHAPTTIASSGANPPPVISQQPLTASDPRTLPTAVPSAAAGRATSDVSSAEPSPTAAPSVTVNGAAIDTQYGPVQVQITVQNRRITRTDAIEYPQDAQQSRDINSQAIPELNREALKAQSAQIDTVSGATYTSGGYQQSLQSALDAAHKAGAR